MSTWHEYYAVCTENDIVLVVEVDHKITKQFEWHKLNDEEFVFKVTHKGKIVKNNTYKLTETTRKTWAAILSNNVEAYRTRHEMMKEED